MTTGDLYLSRSGFGLGRHKQPMTNLVYVNFLALVTCLLMKKAPQTNRAIEASAGKLKN